MTRDPDAREWLLRALVRRQDGKMVGHAGFHGPPGTGGLAPGKAELGYTVFPTFRGHGYATEAAIALLECGGRGIRRFAASVRTGQQWDKEDGLELVFGLDR
jgi:[ribosomal protein S5]-alanine N-acetyltransferase